MIVGGFEVGEVIKVDLEIFWEMIKEVSGLMLVYGENGRKWFGNYIREYGYVFMIERLFFFKELMSREEMKECYGIYVEGIIYFLRKMRKLWVRVFIEDFFVRDVVYF